MTTGCVPKDIPLSSVWRQQPQTDDSASAQKSAESPAFRMYAAPASSEEPLISCTVSEGQARFSSGWFPLKNTDFEIRPGTEKTFAVQGRNRRETNSIFVRFDRGGQRLVFCPRAQDFQKADRIACYSIYALEDDFKPGIKRTFDVPDAVRGSALSCKEV
ncbi:MAG: hypothetical protein EA357_03235 [Micavibrio sp.]|nr:MAG: hypothetical protein EA357_03235 [Micavibrio sp.]